MAYSNLNEMECEPELNSKPTTFAPLEDSDGLVQTTDKTHNVPQDKPKRKRYTVMERFRDMAKRARRDEASQASRASDVHEPRLMQSDLAWLKDTTTSSAKVEGVEKWQNQEAALEPGLSTSGSGLGLSSDKSGRAGGGAAPRQRELVRHMTKGPTREEGLSQNDFGSPLVDLPPSGDEGMKKGDNQAWAAGAGRGGRETNSGFRALDDLAVTGPLFVRKDEVPVETGATKERNLLNRHNKETGPESPGLRLPPNSPHVPEYRGDASGTLLRRAAILARPVGGKETLVPETDASRLETSSMALTRKPAVNFAHGDNKALADAQLLSLHVRCRVNGCNSRHQVCATIDDQPVCLGCFSRWTYHQAVSGDGGLPVAFSATVPYGEVMTACDNQSCRVHILLSHDQCSNRHPWKMQVRGTLSLCAPCGLFYDNCSGAMRPPQKCRLDLFGLALDSATSFTCKNPNCQWDSALGIMVELRGTDEKVRCKADRAALVAAKELCPRCHEHWRRTGETRPKSQCDETVHDLLLRLSTPGRWDGQYTWHELIQVRRQAYAMQHGPAARA
ncbi:hypothetical protein ABEF95_003581 [Exophiala dermatitidis]